MKVVCKFNERGILVRGKSQVYIFDLGLCDISELKEIKELKETVFVSGKTNKLYEHKGEYFIRTDDGYLGLDGNYHKLEKAKKVRAGAAL